MVQETSTASDLQQQKLLYYANLRYDFIEKYTQYMKIPTDYGTGETITMVEVHTLTLIETHPGIMPKEVALMWNRTKGAVSQTLNKLKKKGLIEQRSENGNNKNIHLYVTEIGKTLSIAHRKYDERHLQWAHKELSKSFSEKEIDNFYAIMKRYTEIMENMILQKK